MAAVFFVLALLRVFLLASLRVVRLGAAALKKPKQDGDKANEAFEGLDDDDRTVEVYLDGESQGHLLMAGEALRVTEADRQRLHELVTAKVADRDTIESKADILLEWLAGSKYQERTIEQVHERFRIDEPIGGGALGRLVVARKVFVKDGWVRLSARRNQKNVAAQLLDWLQASPGWMRDLEEVREWLSPVPHGPREEAVKVLLDGQMVAVTGELMVAKRCELCTGAMVGPDGKLSFDCPRCTGKTTEPAAEKFAEPGVT